MDVDELALLSEIRLRNLQPLRCLGFVGMKHCGSVEWRGKNGHYNCPACGVQIRSGRYTLVAGRLYEL